MTFRFTNPDFEMLHSKEWLITNGIGGYASGTLSGANARRYHGMLVASLNPPTNRKILVSKIEASISLWRDTDIEISSNQYPNAIHPKGYRYLTAFERKPLPKFTYEVDGNKLEKTVFMVYGENATIVEYKNAGSTSFPLSLTPFLVDRDYHGLFKEGRVFDFYYEKMGQSLIVYSRYKAMPLYIRYSEGDFEEQRYWMKNIELEKERYRGLDYHEDAYVIGKVKTLLAPGNAIYLLLSTNPDLLNQNPERLKKEALKRLKSLKSRNKKNPFLDDLLLAADQFIVKRKATDSYSILAGYHWFTDWGRDTMIALRGLCIATGKKEICQSIVRTFLKYLNRGMLPNRFPDSEQDEVEYNTVDATLWLFVALYEYYKKFRDSDFIEMVYEDLAGILWAHFEGTRYNIRVTPEGFLSAGAAGLQLTWMDAKVGNHVVTPRQGCAVEIQALWYNALLIFQYFQKNLNLPVDTEILKKCTAISRLLKRHFAAYFYNEKNYLNDVIIFNKKVDDSIRPNQIFVLSLPFSLLNRQQEQKVLETVKNHLFTPYGLRSLSPEATEFKPIYKGSQWERDTAYHQGTAWSFLLGDYWLAYLKLNQYSQKAKEKVSAEIKALENHFYQSNGIHCISEIFDGQMPKEGRGTIQQAWSVGALIMVLEHL